MNERVTQRCESLVVFSDDWGRHPSSCQHLIRQLLPKYRVLWVNTIGTRAPRLDIATARRVGEKVMQWVKKKPVEDAETESNPADSHPNLTVVNPKMWPWFTRTHDRKLNARLLTQQLKPLIEALPQPVTAVTTLPITADLAGRLPVQKWLYYCVDDFGEWPGLDGNTLRRMDIDMIASADSIVAVSEHLQTMIGECGRTSSLLTHGVDLEHWRTDVGKPSVSSGSQSTAVFWGVVDRRLDTAMLTALSEKLPDGKIMLVGPQQDPDPKILNLPNVVAPGPRPFADLPQLATSADVLMMPYADLPVTRAMQPLKMKEYLATGRPVVVSQLPATNDWADCMDVTDNADDFADRVIQRIQTGIPDQQQLKRQRLENESWSAKAQNLEAFLKPNASNKEHTSSELTHA